MNGTYRHPSGERADESFRLTRSELRRWRPSDLPSLVRSADNRAVWIHLRDRFPFPYTEEDGREWIRHASREDPLHSFAIVVDGEAVGGIGLEPQTDVHRCSMEIGYWLGEPYWGRGIMTEAVRAVTDYAIRSFEVCRVFAAVFDPNTASARVLEKAGYVLEGRLRHSVLKDGRLLDQLLYAYVVDDARDG